MNRQEGKEARAKVREYARMYTSVCFLESKIKTNTFGKDLLSISCNLFLHPNKGESGMSTRAYTHFYRGSKYIHPISNISSTQNGIFCTIYDNIFDDIAKVGRRNRYFEFVESELATASEVEAYIEKSGVNPNTELYKVTFEEKIEYVRYFNAFSEDSARLLATQKQIGSERHLEDILTKVEKCHAENF